MVSLRFIDSCPYIAIKSTRFNNRADFSVIISTIDK
jgi:hypothetical protein